MCPPGAIEVLGVRRTVDDVTAEVLRDCVFYEQSGGGVTLSGGDPLFQFGFAHELLRRFRSHGLHTALDTAGYAKQEQFQALVDNSNLVLLDLKLMEPTQHQAFTGIPLEPILRNATWLGAQSKPIWIRTPIIPGFTDSTDNIKTIATFIRENLPRVERWDLLGFNKLCISKWQRLDMPFACADTPLVSIDQMAHLMETARESLVSRITWSGVTREAMASVQHQLE